MPFRYAHHDRAGGRIEEQLVGLIVAIAIEIEHVQNRSGACIERATAQRLATQPIVFNEAHHGSLRNARVADVVLLGEGRDQQEGHAGARTAAPVHRLAAEADRLRLARNAGAAKARSVDLIGARIIGGTGWCCVAWSYQPSESS
jgi:hypothetical protein